MKCGKPYKFKVNLCIDQDQYPDGLHVHPEFLKADMIHLVPMMAHKDSFYYNLATFTWNEFGVKEVITEDSSADWNIGTTTAIPDASMKLIAFITL